MGAQPSTFSHELKNPTRSTASHLTLNDKQHTFTFTQHMLKAVGEQQTLRTHLVYTGTLHPVNTDVVDGAAQGRTVRGCPVYRLRTERVKFEVEWGSEWWQCKKGTLVREDVLANERRRGGGSRSGKCTPIVTSTVTPPNSALFNLSTAVTAPPSPSSVNHSAAAAPSFLPVLLPPAADGMARGFSHSAPLSPAPLSLSERQRSHIDVETSGETLVQPITADSKTKTSTASASAAASSSSAPSSSSSSSASALAANSSATGSTALPKGQHGYPHLLHISYHGAYHSQLQAATSLEEMADLLQADTSDWHGSFSTGGLELHCRVLTQQVHVEYWRPKLEYLWAQVADECPVIMALSNIFYDQTMQEMHLQRGQQNKA